MVHGSLVFREDIGLDFGMEQLRNLSKKNKQKGILKNPGWPNSNKKLKI